MHIMSSSGDPPVPGAGRRRDRQTPRGWRQSRRRLSIGGPPVRRLGGRLERRALRAKLPLLVEPDAAATPEPTTFPDDRLRLVFVCCHPALAPEARTALTLRLVCGLTTHEVARALDLARMLRRLLPADPAVAGLLALLLLTDARRETRMSPDGRLLLLEEQGRRQWDRAAIAEGVALLREALHAPDPGRFALQAAIAAVHACAPAREDTDWREIVAIYELLRRRWPSPVVDLNRAVALGPAFGPDAGLHALAPLADEPQLARYGYLAAVRADFLRRLGRREEAALAYEEALLLTENEVERRFLAGRLAEVSAAR